MMNAVVNTAEAVTEALTAGPFIGPILAGIVAAMGAIQIALIAAQPLPLAQGGILKKPVYSQGYLAGEAGPEAVIPLTQLPQIVRSLNISGVAGGNTVSVNINGPLVQTSGLSRADLERAGNDMWDIVENQARRRGFKIGRA